MAISAGMVKEVRERSGAGMMECKKALVETDGDIEAALEYLRKSGAAKAAKRAGRIAAEGTVIAVVDGSSSVLVEVNSETDFVARTDDFQQLVKELAMHVAATNPLYVRREEVPAETVEREKGIFQSQLEDKGKPPHVVEKILEGKLENYYSEIVLIDQPSIRDPKTTVGQLVASAIAILGENITISRFVRFKIGEG